MELTDLIGNIPYRLALAGGWIDQPFVSSLNPNPTGSMVVVSVEPTFRFMERSGLATGTRRAAMQLWKNGIPAVNPRQLVKDLYAFENQNLTEPSGSQDMIGILYPGINRLDYDPHFEGGVFPRHIESCNDPEIIAWLENVIHILPVEPRPPGYAPLGRKNLDPAWIARLGQTGVDCYNAILAKDTKLLGDAMNRSMACWEVILPDTLSFPSMRLNLLQLMKHYQSQYPGAVYSGCGGGYLYVISETKVPGSFHAKLRFSEKA
jgi:hypothetical protein